MNIIGHYYPPTPAALLMHFNGTKRRIELYFTMNQLIGPPTVNLEVRPFLSRARPVLAFPSDIEAGFAAGAALAALDSIVVSNPPWAGAFRHRLALAAGAATTKMTGRAEDQRALRDAWLLRGARDDPGPAGRTLQAWRLLAAQSNALSDQMVYAAADAFRMKRDIALDQIVAAVQDVKKDGPPPVTAAAESAALSFAKRPDAEPLALWLADAVLAKHMRWPHAIPLFAGQIHHPSLKHEGQRIRPGEPLWSKTCCLAYARAAAQACALAADLFRRADKLGAIAPKLRAKGAKSVIAAIMADDAVTATGLSTLMPDRAMRRLFDRLIALEAIRELSGRTTFRIYGL